MLLHWLKSPNFKTWGFKSPFKDELWLFIQPQHMGLLRASRPLAQGLKQRVLYKQHIDFPQSIVEKSHGLQPDSQDWSRLTGYLHQVLSQEKWQGTVPKVVVSNQLARYTVIPWNTGLAMEAERQAFMRHYFNLAYGESAKTWNLCMSEPDFGQPALASAINADLLQALNTTFVESGMLLSAIYPQLMLAINQTLSEAKKKKQTLDFWLVTIQDERICLALLVDGAWRLVKNVAMETDISLQISALIQREVVNGNGNDAMPVWVYWPKSESLQSLKLPNHRIISVPSHPFDMQDKQAFDSIRADHIQAGVLI